MLELCGEALALGGLAADPAAGRAAAATAIASGAAAERFARMVHALGGPSDLLERHATHLPRAPIARPVHPARSGRVHAVDARALGLAVVELGGGRRHAGHAVDHAVGLTEVRGDRRRGGAGRSRWPWCMGATRRRWRRRQNGCAMPISSGPALPSRRR